MVQYGLTTASSRRIHAICQTETCWCLHCFNLHPSGGNFSSVSWFACTRNAWVYCSRVVFICFRDLYRESVAKFGKLKGLRGTEQIPGELSRFQNDPELLASGVVDTGRLCVLKIFEKVLQCAENPQTTTSPMIWCHIGRMCQSFMVDQPHHAHIQIMDDQGNQNTSN